MNPSLTVPDPRQEARALLEQMPCPVYWLEDLPGWHLSSYFEVSSSVRSDSVMGMTVKLFCTEVEVASEPHEPAGKTGWLHEWLRLNESPLLWSAVHTHWLESTSDGSGAAAMLGDHVRNVARNSRRPAAEPRAATDILTPGAIEIDSRPRPCWWLDENSPFAGCISQLDDSVYVSAVVRRELLPPEYSLALGTVDSSKLLQS